MLQKLRKRMGREEGFTLIELLVVMLIIGILAAIAIPSFFNQRNKAKDAGAKTAVRTAQTAIETFATDNGSLGYAGATIGNLQTIEPTLNSTTNTLAYGTTPATPTANTYDLKVTQSSTGDTFSIRRASDGTTTFPCTGTGGGCNGTSWSGN
jgi:type IV pilus assembly protein PilA